MQIHLLFLAEYVIIFVIDKNNTRNGDNYGQSKAIQAVYTR